MKIEYFHASKFGNGAMVAEEFKQQMTAKGASVDVHHIREMKRTDVAPADLYVFSSPGRMGKPIGSMRRFLKRLSLTAGTKYALLTTEVAPKPDRKTGRVPTEEELARYQRVRPIMNETLQAKGLVEVAEDKVLVTGLIGPLEEGWRDKVQTFAAKIPIINDGADSMAKHQFMSPAWIEMAREQITAALEGVDLGHHEFTLCEEFTNPPNDLRREGAPTIGFFVRVVDGRAEVGDHPIDEADFKVVSDYTDARAIARDPGVAAAQPELMQERIAQGRLTIVGNPADVPTALAALDIHRLLASRTL